MIEAFIVVAMFATQEAQNLEASRRVRPPELMNRAEMVKILGEVERFLNVPVEVPSPEELRQMSPEQLREALELLKLQREIKHLEQEVFGEMPGAEKEVQKILQAVDDIGKEAKRRADRNEKLFWLAVGLTAFVLLAGLYALRYLMNWLRGKK